MKTVARYTWGKTERGYGWNVWEGCGLSIERDGKTGYWGVYEADGSPLCVCTDWNGAQKVVGRIRKLHLAMVTPGKIPDFAVLGQTKAGWEFYGVQSIPESPDRFATRAEAEAYLLGCPHPTTSLLLRSIIDGSRPSH
jgi:hypothetical protein